jgi:predicted nuclease with TOPRIM domain|tara:strand:+ start:1057 stop:1698 length:642 start_codon:yes stop_codon:yes gene_type:complete
MAVFDGPDLLEEDFPATAKGATLVNEDREELDDQASSLQTQLANLNRARDKLEREKATVEESRRRFSEFQTGREEMLHELTRSLGLLEEAQLDAQRDAEQMARSMDDLRDALGKVDALVEVDTHDEDWKVLLTRNLTTIENARMELNSARLKWTLLSGLRDDEGQGLAAPAQPGQTGLPMPKSFGQLCLWGLALTWPVLLIGAVITAVLLLRG